MIDVHSHILPNIDEGSKSLETSIEMLKEEISQGVKSIILTPHYNSHYKPTKEKVLDCFNRFSAEVKKLELPVNLYLGQEVHYEDELFTDLENPPFLTINGSKYILLEFREDKNIDVYEAVYEVKACGYIPIVAHIERCKYLSIEDVSSIKALGAKIQINAEFIKGGAKRLYYKKVMALLKKDLVDFVASDVHHFRPNYIKLAYEFISKKFGKDRSDALFIENAKELIK